jgi:hypothetical protein
MMKVLDFVTAVTRARESRKDSKPVVDVAYGTIPFHIVR